MSRTIKVTMIEDEPADVVLLNELLSTVGLPYSITVIDDGEQAMEYVRNLGKADIAAVPDLLLLDLNLPKISGHELLSEIRRNRSLDGLRVVVLTTSENPQDLRLVLQQGASCFITKPPTWEALRPLFDAVRTSRFKSNPRILLVEDNPDDVIYIKEMLQGASGMSAQLECVDCYEAALVALQDGQFDFVLADLGLPDASGLAVLNGLRRVAADIPIVVLTGLDDEEMATRALELGAQDYLVKGFVDSKSLRRSLNYAATRTNFENLQKEMLTFEASIMRDFVENAPIAIARFDSNFCLHTFNRVFADAVPVPQGPSSTQSVRDLLPGVPYSNWQALIADGRPFFVESCPISGDGDNVELLWDIHCWPIKTLDGDTSGGIVIGQDVTDKVHTQAQRDAVVATLAHDMRNPLIGADRVLRFFLSGRFGVLSPEAEEVVLMLSESNTSLLGMVQNLLDVCQFETGGIVVRSLSVDLRKVFAAALEPVQLLARERDVSIELSIADDLNFVVGESREIERLIINLMRNAVVFSPSNSSVRVSARNEGKMVEVSFIDQGAAITPEEEAWIFKRFGQNQSSRYRLGPDTGSSLYLCKQIVDAHGGEIRCFSTATADGDTTFVVRLPVYTFAGEA
ncbi:MAG: response regulator [Cyanobacteria bacterium SZAS LIN-2]|nr:response regulator [Cyanobacteria bacterium SZAS LIN-3]MBS1995319.1 response regulator [Cyanobacteria bacterium SZAS LIN-2]